MTDPSKMTDDELSQAIAEKLGWTHCDLGHWHLPKVRFLHAEKIPDYPGDIAAAMGLAKDLVKKGEWQFKLAIGSFGSIATFSRIPVYDPIRDRVCVIINEDDGETRAISEAAYQALKAERGK